MCLPHYFSLSVSLAAFNGVRRPKVDANIDVFIESSLSAECSLVILDTVEELIQVRGRQSHTCTHTHTHTHARTHTHTHTHNTHTMHTPIFLLLAAKT